MKNDWNRGKMRKLWMRVDMDRDSMINVSGAWLVFGRYANWWYFVFRLPFFVWMEQDSPYSFEKLTAWYNPVFRGHEDEYGCCFESLMHLHSESDFLNPCGRIDK